MHGRLRKWKVKLAEYYLKYVHVRGSQDVIADGLSWWQVRYYDQRDSESMTASN